MVLEGPNAIGMVRTMVGVTKPTEAAPGTIRGDLAVEMGQNLIHASDAPETASTELALWFRPEELVSYEREIDRWVMGPEAR
jgi:nucleoside-diphosphate kinase